MRFSDRIIDVDLDGSAWDALIADLRPGEKVSAAAILSAMDTDGEAETFAELDVMAVPLDITALPKFSGSSEAALRLRQEEQLAKEGRLPDGLEENDPLRLYLEEIGAVGADGEIDVLGRQLLQANAAGADTFELCQRLLNMSLEIVADIAREFTGYGVLLLDLIQEGSMALWQKMPEFRGDDFVSLRDTCIRQAMKKTVILQAYADGVGQKMRRAMEDYRAVDERLLTELGRNPTLEEIAEAMHLSPEEVSLVEQNLKAARSISRAVPEPQPEEEDPEDQLAVEDTALFQMRQRISELLSVLAPEEAEILKLRFGLEGGLPMSPEETGRKLGLTAAEVVAKEAAALAKLRN